MADLDDLAARLALLEAKAGQKPPPSPEQIARERRLEEAAIRVGSNYIRGADGSILRVDGFDADGHAVDPEDLRRGFTTEHIEALEAELANAREKARIHAAVAAQPDPPHRHGAAERAATIARNAQLEVEAVEVELTRCRAGLEAAQARRAAAGQVAA